MYFEPLLPPGIHDLEVSEIGNHFLSKFSTSTTRAVLIAGLQDYLDCIRKYSIDYEIWIDGSFVTKKENPRDIDMVVFASNIQIQSIPISMREELELLLVGRSHIRQKFGLDVLFAVSEDKEMRSYWRGWYGFDRNEHPKGIARIFISQ